MVFHVLNRGNDRREIFDDPPDFEAFLGVMKETQERVPMRILAYCLLPNHWHLLLWPVKASKDQAVNNGTHPLFRIRRPLA